jgi:hypothetical protein
MTPKEKAKELVNKYIFLFEHKNGKYLEKFEAKQCIIISIDEILDTLYQYHYDSESGAYKYWQDVKQIIEKI